jgi:hypothetical protein
MTQPDLFLHMSTSAAIDDLAATIDGADEVYVKKLALNDWQWTEVKNKHQGGPYIPHEDRDSGFFPKLGRKPRKQGEPIYEIYFEIFWPEVGRSELVRLVHYTSKGQETHLTNVPHKPFTGLSPASYLVIAKRDSPKRGHQSYQAITVDSSSDECSALVDLFEIKPTFVSGRFTPRRAAQSYQDKISQFIDEALAAFKAGTLASFSQDHAAIPNTKSLAASARNEYLRRHPGVSNFNPFNFSAPGDVVLEISRDIEYQLFREYELRYRSLAIVKVIIGTNPKDASIESAFRAVIREFPQLDKIMLSAAQQRKSRAGYSFEHHIETLLVDGGIPHEVQVIIESKKRPDFVLPSFAVYNKKNRPHGHALVLSAKTTLRERWKQVTGEIKNCDLYLATVDENIAANTIEDMGTCGITLVVPESLKDSDITVYRDCANVIAFRDFFSREINIKRRPIWTRLGIEFNT